MGDSTSSSKIPSNQQRPALVNATGQAVYTSYGSRSANTTGEPSFNKHRDIGVDAAALPVTNNNQTDNSSVSEEESSWQKCFQVLKRFKEVNGHCNDRERLGELGRWIAEQHSQYSLEKLSDMRISQLEALGIVWSKNDSLWDCRYEELKQYKAKNGHCRVRDAEGILGQWARQQRLGYDVRKQGKESPLTDEQIVKLVLVDFVGFYGDFLNKYICEARFQQLKQFKDEHGHCNVPPSHHPPLCIWVERSRREYLLFKDGRISPMNREQVQRFDAIGVEWTTTKAADDSVDINASPTTSGDSSWDMKYNELKKFKARNGHCTTSHELAYVKLELQNWAELQRNEYAILKEGGKSSLTVEKLLMMDDLKFEFQHDVYCKNLKWEKNFRWLKKCKAATGLCDMPSCNNIPWVHFKWLKHQRRMYQSFKNGENSDLTREQIERFDLIGVEWATTKKTEKHEEHAHDCISKGYGDGAGDLYSSHGGNKRKSAEESDKHSKVCRLLHLQSPIEPIGQEKNLTGSRPSLIVPGAIIACDAKDTGNSHIVANTPDDSYWNMNYKVLKENEDQYGSYIIITGSPEIFLWAERQRQEYCKVMKGKTSYLTNEQFLLLKALNFEHKERKHKIKFSRERRFRQLMEFKAKHEHCNVPLSNEALYKWVKKCRTECQLFKRGWNSEMTKEFFERYSLLDTEWNVNTMAENFEKCDGRISAAAAVAAICDGKSQIVRTKRSRKKEAWWERYFNKGYKEFEQFKTNNGHCDVPLICKQLYKWVIKCRLEYQLIQKGEKLTLLTEGQAKRLDFLGVQWTTMKTIKKHAGCSQECVSKGTKENDKEATSAIDDSLNLHQKKTMSATTDSVLQPQSKVSNKGEHKWLSRYCKELTKFKNIGSKSYEVWEVWQTERHRLYMECIQAGLTNDRIEELEEAGLNYLGSCYEDVNTWKPSEGNKCMFQGMEIFGSESV